MKKYLLAGIIAACVCGGASVNVFAEPVEAPVHQQSAEMEWQKLHETWQNMSKRQKDQLYKAREAVDKADCNFIDRAIEFNLIDKEIGEKMKTHIRARTERIKQDGDLPMFRRGIKQRSPDKGNAS